MRRLEEVASLKEAQDFYYMVIRNLDVATVLQIEGDPRILPGDSDKVKAGKAAYAKFQSFGHGVIDLRPRPAAMA